MVVYGLVRWERGREEGAAAVGKRGEKKNYSLSHVFNRTHTPLDLTFKLIRGITIPNRKRSQSYVTAT